MEYMPTGEPATSHAAGPSSPIAEQDDEFADFQCFLAAQEKKTSRKTQLEQYLDEPLFPMDAPDFEVLLWWKANEAKFPVLAKMARDILCGRAPP